MKVVVCIVAQPILGLQETVNHSLRRHIDNDACETAVITFLSGKGFGNSCKGAVSAGSWGVEITLKSF